MNDNQQQLIFEKGITNIPSDALCSDNALEECVGMTYENGEHRVIQNPKVSISSANGKIIYIHKYDDKVRYIHIVKIMDNIYYLRCSADGVNAVEMPHGIGHTEYDDDKVTVTSVGKTLIVNHEGDSLDYYLWQDYDWDSQASQGTPYFDIGPLPEPDIKFWLEGSNTDFRPELWPDQYDEDKDNMDCIVYSSASSAGIIADNYMSDIEIDQVIQNGGQEDYDNLTVGLYKKNLKSVAEKKGFARPFFVRYAFEMYDGSYTHVSNPVLMLPCVTRNSFSIFYENEVLMTFTRYCKMKYSMSNHGLENFSDIIKNVAVFVTDGIEVYDTTTSQPLELVELNETIFGYIDSYMDRYYYRSADDEQSKVYADGIYRIGDNQYATYNVSNSIYGSARELQLHPGLPDTGKRYFVRLDTLKQKVSYDKPGKQEDLLDDIKGASVFYKLCDLGLKNATGDIAENIGLHILDNLTSQEQLEEDDWFSRSQFKPDFLYSYNSRLNMANVSRSLFAGYDHFLCYDTGTDQSTYRIAVRILCEAQTYRYVEKTFSTNESMGLYFYYPDSRADYFWIKKNGTVIMAGELEEHSGLNGAFYLEKLPGFNNATEPTAAPQGTESYPSGGFGGYETLPNYIITSEVNNPWVFKAEGYNKVGTGKIIGMSTTTQALSQGQFGQFPLLVFSENGVWAMSVNDTGMYQSIHPMSREVCNNSDSITQTDGAVFFSSEKGLMVVVGSDVKCVSEQLSGKEGDFSGVVPMGSFHDYLEDCFIAYDYRDSLLWIFNNSRDSNNDYCWIYAIKSGTFSKFHLDSAVSSIVNNYPDTLLQSGSTIYTLTGRDNINDDEDSYTGLLITRPMKLENGLALKSITDVSHIHDLSSSASMKFTIYGSNNLKRSLQLNSLRGTPWKYYRFRFDFSNMKATCRFSGTVLVTQERRNNKLR